MEKENQNTNHDGDHNGTDDDASGRGITTVNQIENRLNSPNQTDISLAHDEEVHRIQPGHGQNTSEQVWNMQLGG